MLRTIYTTPVNQLRTLRPHPTFRDEPTPKKSMTIGSIIYLSSPLRPGGYGLFPHTQRLSGSFSAS